MLSAMGFDAEHVHDIGLGNEADWKIWEYALARQATIMTKDEDFASLLALRGNGPSIVWMRIGNTSRQALLRWFEPMVPAIVMALESGEKLIEVA